MSGTIINPTTVSAFDGNTNQNNLFGKAGEDIVAELHGKYYTQAYRGQLFWANQIAATVSTIYSATTQTGFFIWNTSTNKNITLVRSVFTPIVIGSVETTIGYAFTKNAGTGIATGGPVTAITQVAAVTPVNTNTSSTIGSIATVGTGSSLTTAPTLYAALGTFETNAITAGYGSISVDHDGMFILGPGTFASVAVAVANASQTVETSLFWYESPL